MKETSKFLSYVLRHAPETIGLVLDENGWASVDELVLKAREAGRTFDRATLLDVVATSDKKRFTLSPDGTRIRAAQGHSVDVDLDIAPMVPPAMLFHGTAARHGSRHSQRRPEARAANEGASVARRGNGGEGGAAPR